MFNKQVFMVGVGLALALGTSPIRSESLRAGAVYTMSNAAGGNTVAVYDRDADGSLLFAGEYPTGGLGTGGGLGNQGGLALSDNDRWLLAVNAGSDDVSVFEVRPHGLALTDRVSSAGSRPISVTEARGVVYVLNAGSASLAGFRLNRRGQLVPIPGSAVPIGGAGVDPAQIGLGPDAGVLVVTLKDSSELVTRALDRRGTPGSAMVYPSNGLTPFGFSFGKRNQLFVTEAAGGAPGAGTLSSYVADETGALTTISASVATHQTAACWASVSPDGRFAYTANTPAATLSGFEIDVDGQVSLLDPSGVTAMTGAGSAPVDMAFAQNGRYLYALNSGTHTIGAFRVLENGALEALPFAPAVPLAANGIAAR